MRYEVIPAIICNDTKLSNEIINGLQKEKKNKQTQTKSTREIKNIEEM